MRNEIAEWVLSQAAEPKQARTILGDLLEAQPGPVVLWVAVLRATASIARHQPRQILVRFLWFACQLCFYVCMAWTFNRTKYPILLLATWLIVLKMLEKMLEWCGLVEPRNASLLLLAAFSFWIGKHLIGDSTAHAVLFALVMVAPDMWIRWRKNRPQGSDRPVAG